MPWLILVCCVQTAVAFCEDVDRASVIIGYAVDRVSALPVGVGADDDGVAFDGDGVLAEEVARPAVTRRQFLPDQDVGSG